MQRQAFPDIYFVHIYVVRVFPESADLFKKAVTPATTLMQKAVRLICGFAHTAYTRRQEKRPGAILPQAHTYTVALPPLVSRCRDIFGSLSSSELETAAYVVTDGAGKHGIINVSTEYKVHGLWQVVRVS